MRVARIEVVTRRGGHPRLARVLRAGNEVDTCVGGQRHVLGAQRISGEHRRAFLPILRGGIAFHPQRIKAIVAQNAVRFAGDRIGHARSGKRKRILRHHVIFELRAGAPWLAECGVEKHAAHASGVRQRAVEHLASARVLVKALIDKIAQKTPALRNAESQRDLDAACRIGRAGGIGAFVFHERYQVARCVHADAQYARVFRGVVKFVD